MASAFHLFEYRFQKKPYGVSTKLGSFGLILELLLSPRTFLSLNMMTLHIPKKHLL